jgi:hypothetical protein
VGNEQLTSTKIQAVIFDYGGVLMRTVTPLPRHELAHRFGLPPDAGQIGRWTAAGGIPGR